MRNKRLVTLCIAAISFIGLYAQEITEINVEKPGKLMKQVKKELTNIKKLKLSGTVNCEDLITVGEMPNLEYLDLRDMSFAKDDKHNDGDCMRHNDVLFLHGHLSSLKVLYTPLSGFKELKYKNYPHPRIVYLPVGMSYEEKVDTLYITGSPSGNESSDEEIAKKLGIQGDPVYVKGILAEMRKDPEMKKNLDQLKKTGINTSTNFYASFLIFQKKAAADLFDFNSISSSVILVEENQWLHVNKWVGNSITKEQFKKIDSFNPKDYGYGFFRDVKLPNEIELSARITSLPAHYFEKHDEIKSIILPEGLIEIGEKSIPGSVTRIKIPATVKSVKYLDVDTIELVTQMPPEWLKNYWSWFRRGDKKPKHHFVIPDGTLKEYYAFKDDLDYIDNAPGGSYTINVPKGNTILSYISLNDLLMADSLTVSGVLYEQDFSFIKKAKKLKYLDISQCYTTYSEEYMKELEQKDQVMAAIFNAISAQLDNQYQDYQIGTTDYKINKVIADEIAKVYSQGYSKDKMCVIPHKALEDMKSLEYVKLPILVTRIGPMAFSACSNLKIVEFPPYLTQIGKQAFEFCHKLKDFELPKTVNWIQSKAFYNCNNLTKFVFPDVRKFDEFSYEDDILSACISLEEIVYSEGMKKIPTTGYKCYSLRKVTIPSTATQINIQDRNWGEYKGVPCEFHIKATTPPSFYTDNYSYEHDWGDNATLFIPKGTITAYMTKYGTRLKYVEE